MMNRRTLLNAIPFLGAAGVIAASSEPPLTKGSPQTYFEYEAEMNAKDRAAKDNPQPSEDSAIITAALIRIGWLAPGNVPSQAEHDNAWFHLDSMRRVEGWKGPKCPSPSQMSVELATRLAPQCLPYPKWQGDQPEWMPPAEEVMASAPKLLYEETESLDLFYSGFHQWDERVAMERLAAGRPVLIFNRLPMLVGATFFNRTPGILPLTVAQHAHLRRVITRRNRDAQVLYNLEMSNMAERSTIKRW